LYGCETWSLTLREELKVRVFEKGYRGEYLDLRGRSKWQAGEYCTVRSFVTCALHQILFRAVKLRRI
jgi:hypothetical protein